jgi:hypothetical protein
MRSGGSIILMEPSPSPSLLSAALALGGWEGPSTALTHGILVEEEGGKVPRMLIAGMRGFAREGFATLDSTTQHSTTQHNGIYPSRYGLRREAWGIAVSRRAGYVQIEKHS